MMSVTTVVYATMAGLGLALAIWQAVWLRRHPPTESRVNKMTRGRLLVIGIIFVAAGVGGLVASKGVSDIDDARQHLLPVTNRCNVPLEFTVTSLDGAQQRYEIPSGGLGALAVNGGAQIRAHSSLGENTFSVPLDAPQIMAEWIVVGAGCTTLEPDQL